MKAAIAQNPKIERLRAFEWYCYRVAFYLLDDEKLATETAMDTLLRVSLQDGFFQQPFSVQRRLIKRTTMEQAIQIKKRQIMLQV